MTKDEFTDFLKSTFNVEQSTDLLLHGLYGNSAEYHYERSVDLMMKADFLEALRAIDTGLEFNEPTFNAPLYSRRATCNIFLQNTQQAELDLANALRCTDELDSTGFRHGIILELAKCMYKNGNFHAAKKAIENFEKAPQLPDKLQYYDISYQYLYLYARILCSLGDRALSRDMLCYAENTLALKMEEDPDDIYQNSTIETYERSNNFDSLRKALEGPDDPKLAVLQVIKTDFKGLLRNILQDASKDLSTDKEVPEFLHGLELMKIAGNFSVEMKGYYSNMLEKFRRVEGGDFSEEEYHELVNSIRDDVLSEFVIATPKATKDNYEDDEHQTFDGDDWEFLI